MTIMTARRRLSTLWCLWMVFTSSWVGQFSLASPTHLIHVDYPLPQVFVNYGHGDEFSSTAASTYAASYPPASLRREQQEVTITPTTTTTTTATKSNVTTLDRYPPDAVFAPIRIRFITDAIQSRRGQSDSIDAEIQHIVEVVLPQVAAQWAGFLSVMPMVGGRNYTAADSCLGRILEGKVRDQYVGEADLVIFVSGEDKVPFGTGGNGPLEDICTNTRTAAAAIPCLTDQWDRPFTGSMNFCLGNVAQWKDDFPNDVQQQVEHFTGAHLRGSHIYPDLVRIAMHEMAHVLGMNALLFYHFREPDGTPRTPRPIPYAPHTCVLTGRGIMDDKFPANNTIQLVRSPDGNSSSYYVVTPRVKKVARNHLNCQQLVGARLETQGDCVGSHWHEREYYGELMSSQYSLSSENALSALTLALLEDSGWYIVDYRNAEHTVFGIGAGCSFDQGRCIVNDQIPSYGAGAFCTIPIHLSDQSDDNAIGVGCDPGYKQWTLCDLYDISGMTDPLATEGPIHYFSNPNLVSSFAFADSCPVPDFPLGLDCTREDPYSPFYGMESTGPDSRCFQASQYDAMTNRTVHRPACLRVTCDAQNGVVRVSEGPYELICARDEQVLQIPMLIGGMATLRCPKLAAVCPDLFSCPADCSGRGTCVIGKNSVASCHCFPNETATGAGCYPLVGDEASPTVGTTTQAAVPTTTPTIIELAPSASQSATTPKTPQHEESPQHDNVPITAILVLIVVALSGTLLVFFLFRRRSYVYDTVAVNQESAPGGNTTIV